MKILKLLLIVALVFSFVGCDKEEPIDESPLECGENQKEENGVCVIDDQDLEDIKVALNDTNELTNYQIEVTITFSENVEEYIYQMTLSFDDQVALFEMGENDIVYYEYTTSGINQYTKQGDSFVMETVTLVNDFKFYQNLDPKWFTKTNDYYILGSQYLAQISPMIETYFPEGSLNNFKIGLSDEYLDYFMFDLINGDETYQITFTFDSIGEIDLELPQV